MDRSPLLIPVVDDEERQVDLISAGGTITFLTADAPPNVDCDTKNIYKRPDNFLEALQCDAPEVVNLLLSLGILSPWALRHYIKSNVAFFLYNISYGVALLAIPFFVFASIAYFSIIHETLGVYIEYGVLIDTLLFIQVLILLPFLRDLISHLYDQRKSDRLLFIELSAFKSLMKTCYLFCFVFYLLILMDLILKFRLSIANWLRVNILEFVSIGLMSTAVLFIAADCRVCVSLVDTLCRKATEQTLSMKELLQTRQDIDDRVHRHARTISLITFMAVLNILYLLVFDIILPKWTAQQLLDLLPWKLASYAKEIVFLMIIFNESAKLNEKADILVSVVANNDGRLDAHVVDESELEDPAVLRKQVLGLMLFSALSTKPISFPIAGRRWTKMDLILQLVAISATTVIVFIRAILMDQSL
eukprot:gene8566-6163_t